MKRVLLTDNAANEIMRIRNDELGTLSCDKSAIADAFGELSTLINLGRERENEDLQNCADGILKVMEVLNKYNGLLNVLSETSERLDGGYTYDKPEQDYDGDRDCALWGNEVELLRGVFAKRPDIVPYAPVDVDAITMAEAAVVLGISMKELKDLINKERNYNGKE